MRLHMDEKFTLTEAQLRTLSSLCDTLVPAIQADDKDTQGWTEAQKKILALSAVRTVRRHCGQREREIRPRLTE